MSESTTPDVALATISDHPDTATLAQQAMEPKALEPGGVYALLDGKDGLKVIDTDQWDPTPRRATARRTVTDAESFVGYLNRHRRPGTEVFAHTLSSSVVGIIDSHEGTDKDAGWQDHRLTLALEHSKAWEAWAKRDLGQDPNAWFKQTEFAEFIEARAPDVVEPDHAQLIDIAMTFEAKTRADFTSSARLDNGDVRLDYQETTTAKAGQKGSIEIPKKLLLAVRPYVGGPIYHLTAAFRYRLNGGNLLLGYALERPEAVLEAAFADIVEEIRDGKTVKKTDSGEETRVHDGIGDVPIFYGRP